MLVGVSATSNTIFVATEVEMKGPIFQVVLRGQAHFFLIYLFGWQHLIGMQNTKLGYITEL